MGYLFRWNEWNQTHIAAHDVAPEEAEFVIGNARAPFPRAVADDRFLVVGQTEAGTYIQVVYIFDPPGVVFVIHARPLTDREKRRFRRGRK